MSSPRPHIRWQDVFEFAPDYIRANGFENSEKFRQILVAYEKSPAGQQWLTKLYEAQQLIPRDHHWKLSENDQAGNTPQMVKQIHAEMTTREDPRKLYFGTIAGKRRADGLPMLYYSRSLHSLAFPFPVLEAAVYVLPNGEKAAVMFPPDVILTHEIQHAIDNIQRLFGNGVHYNRACEEARGIAAENQYMAQAYPRPLRRELYTDPDFLFKLKLEKPHQGTPGDTGSKFNLPNILRKLGVPHEYRQYTLTKEQVKENMEELGSALYLASGCKTYTDQEMLKEARELFRKNNVTTPTISDTEMLEWLNTGLKRERLWKYEPKR